MKILIVKTSSIGDIIQSFHVLNYLKSKHENLEIDWVVEDGFSDIVKAHPLVNNIISLNTKKWKKNLFKLNTIKDICVAIKNLRKEKYDVLFDLQGNIKSSLVCFFSKAKRKVGFGAQSVPEKINLFFVNQRINVYNSLNIRLQYLFLVQKYYNDVNNFCIKPVDFSSSDEIASFKSDESKNIVVSIGSNWFSKMLDLKDLEEFLLCIKKKFKATFLFVWNTEEELKKVKALKKHIDSSYIIPRMSLIDIQKLLKESSVLISMDSSILHLCGTTNTASFSIFGPSSSFIYKPLGNIHYSYQGTCPYNVTFIKRCKYLRNCKTAYCIKKIDVDDLFNRFSDFFIKLNS